MARRRARIEQSRGELDEFADEFDTWLALRQRADEHGQYTSQLGSLGRVIVATNAAIRTELDALDAAGPAGGVYESCFRRDQQVVWVRRLWDYFREKWDQRDDDRLRPVLAAADEIVWSSYATPFRHLGVEPPTAPLPYVATESSPYAIVRGDVPQPLRTSDELLSEILDELPLPVIGIARFCVSSPWWLVLLAHEVGHQVAADLGGTGYATAIGHTLGRAAAVSEGSPAGNWDAWSQEVFADAFAVGLVGGSHVWALQELERWDDQRMLKPLPGYPPPLLRQALAAETLKALGLGADSMLPSFDPVPDPAGLDVDPDDRDRAERLLATVPQVAAALASQPLLREKALPSLTAWNAEIGRDVGWWKSSIAGASAIVPRTNLKAARLATAGAVAEWADVSTLEDDGERADRGARLRSRMLELVPLCREESVRAAPAQPGTELEGLAERVARRVLALDFDEPMAASATAGVA